MKKYDLLTTMYVQCPKCQSKALVIPEVFSAVSAKMSCTQCAFSAHNSISSQPTEKPYTDLNYLKATRTEKN